MNVSIFGLGYVGCVSAACFARDGHQVIGVDINKEKVQAINAGHSPIIEPGLLQLIQDAVMVGRLKATHDVAYAISQSELALICVGTPSNQDGSLNLEYVERVCHEIGSSLCQTSDYTVIVVRSTILPGVATECLIPILENMSGMKVGIDFGFCVNPEFLREGSAIADFDDPPYTIVGQQEQKSGDYLVELYDNVDAPIYRVSLGAAEMIKYSSNAFHALKVVFANEIGSLCQMHGVDSHEVMDVFMEDNKLNISARYLKPGFAFGGSCLPKDLRALLHSARQHSVLIPVLESIIPSNQLQIEKVLQMLMANGERKVGLIGLSFKANTDDLRESPAVELVERLIGKGFEIRIYDREVSLGQLHGSNRAYIERVIPHLASLFQPTLQETIEVSEAIVVTKHLSKDEYKIMTDKLRSNQSLFDLVRLDGKGINGFQGNYHGIAW